MLTPLKNGPTDDDQAQTSAHIQPLWLYLHLPQLQLDSLLAQQQSLNTVAVAIVEPTRMQLLQVSSPAKAAGISTDMNLGTASALCRELQVLPYSAEMEADKLAAVAEELYALTADISFFSANGLLLRVHNMLDLYGGIKAYWLAIKHVLNTQQLTYHYAIAHTPLAAKLLACSQWDHISDNSQHIQQALQACSLQQCELDKKSLGKLNRIGITTLKQLQQIPLSDIAQRFNQELAQYLGHLSGEIPHPVCFYQPEDKFERKLELLYEINNAPQLLKPLSQLLKAMEQFLKIHDWLTMSIELTLQQREQPDRVLSIGSQQGEYKAEVWQRLIALKLEQLTLQAPVIQIQLAASETHPRTPEKADLLTEKRGALSQLQLVALLQAKLGEQSVFNLAFHDDHRPEHANQVCANPTHAHGLAGRQGTSHSTQKISEYTPMRPFFILPEPRPLTEQVDIESGPERIQTGWWDDAAIERDYFIARSPAGQWYWIFRTPKQEWYLHGIFS